MRQYIVLAIFDGVTVSDCTVTQIFYLCWRLEPGKRRTYFNGSSHLWNVILDPIKVERTSCWHLPKTSFMAHTGRERSSEIHYDLKTMAPQCYIKINNKETLVKKRTVTTLRVYALSETYTIPLCLIKTRLCRSRSNRERFSMNESA